jgi:hypothetical protein
MAIGICCGVISGCGPEGVGTISRDPSAKAFNPSTPDSIPRTKKRSKNNAKDESELPGQKALPKAARKKG